MQNNYNPYNDILKDEIIEFIDQKIDGDKAYIFFKPHPRSDYICECCGETKFIKNGIKSRKIKYPLLNGYDTTLFFSVYRIECKKCGKMSAIDCSIVPKGENIPLATKILIMNKLKELVTFEHVASECSISKESVLDIFDALYEVPKYPLSETLCFD